MDDRKLKVKAQNAHDAAASIAVKKGATPRNATITGLAAELAVLMRGR